MEEMNGEGIQSRSPFAPIQPGVPIGNADIVVFRGEGKIKHFLFARNHALLGIIGRAAPNLSKDSTRRRLNF